MNDKIIFNGKELNKDDFVEVYNKPVTFTFDKAGIVKFDKFLEGLTKKYIDDKIEEGFLLNGNNNKK